jgi:hypothetical protein
VWNTFEVVKIIFYHCKACNVIALAPKPLTNQELKIPVWGQFSSLNPEVGSTYKAKRFYRPKLHHTDKPWNVKPFSATKDWMLPNTHIAPWLH